MRMCVCVCLAYTCIVCICLRAVKYIWEIFPRFAVPSWPRSAHVSQGNVMGGGGEYCTLLRIPFEVHRN